MSFHFKKLVLKDWLVYGGTTEIEFSDHEPGRNIITIHGQNGFGKTSLLRALKYLFHDSLNRQEYFEHWHERAQKEGEGSMEVTLDFEYRGRLFQLSRRVEFKARADGTVYTYPSVSLINGQNGEIEDQAEDKIELMIPQKSQQFVFFDGAEITRYAQQQHEKGVREAIERMLGIPAVRNLKEDLAKLIEDLETEQAEIAVLQGESQDLVQEIERLQQELAEYDEQQQDKEEKLQGIERSIKELENETAQISVIQSERNELDEKRARLADQEERRQEKAQQIDAFLKRAPLRMLRGPLTQITQEGLAQQQNGSGGSYAAYVEQRKFLESLLDAANCVCGRPVTDDIEDQLQEEIDRLDTLAEKIREARTDGLFSQQDLTQLTATLQRLHEDGADGTELFDQRSAIDDKIEEIETDIRRLERKLEGHENADVRENIRLLGQLGEKAASLRAEIESLSANVERVSKDIQDGQRRLDDVTAGTTEGRRVTQTLQKARSLHSAVDDYVSRLVEGMRAKIEKEATEIFTDITNKPQEYAGVHVKDDYTLEVYRHDSTRVENDKLSAGEKEVLAYSFITALNLATPTPAPFVMDTPFGHLDSKHRDRLLLSLPQLEVQVILLATDRDLPENERDTIQPYLADEFVIQRHQQTARSSIQVQ